MNSMRTTVTGPQTLRLGKQGEHLTREFAFPETADWHEAFGEGAAQLLVRPPDGADAYPAVLDEENHTAVWRVTAAETQHPGYGCCELRWSVGGQTVKSRTYVTYTAPGLSGEEGEPWEDYLEKVLSAASQALEAASRAENAAVHSPVIKDGSWWVWDPAAGDYTDTGTGVSTSGGGGTLDHRSLTYRDAENQHPITSITGLAEAVGRIPAPTQAITNAELEELLHE